MTATMKDKRPTGLPFKQENSQNVEKAIKESWDKIAPFWPLKNLIAVNPLKGFEYLPIEEAVKEGATYFQQKDFPQPLEAINRETIKWMQMFFDEGQATISVPLRKLGLYKAWKELARFDIKLNGNDSKNQEWLALLPESPLEAVFECLLKLNISAKNHVQFLTLMMTTLPGWAAYVKYRAHWVREEAIHQHSVTETDYLAVRLAITYMLWPKASELIEWHLNIREVQQQKPNPIEEIVEKEHTYRLPLLDQLKVQAEHIQESPSKPKAQWVFCIDVRSEPFRRALESIGDYETFGFAGFFGLPVSIADEVTEESYNSCPVLLTPRHTIKESPSCSHKVSKKDHAGYARLKLFNRFYQSLKYTFSAPFALVETLGLASGILMGLRSFAPKLTMRLKSSLLSIIRPHVPVAPELSTITFADQCTYAEEALSMIGLTSGFAPLVVLCGHGSTTQNNAYSSSLDCGACGGRNGLSNARILATILNDRQVRKQLAVNGITIHESTTFIAAQHNTTTDEVSLHRPDSTHLEIEERLQQLQQDLQSARKLNTNWRCTKMGYNSHEIDTTSETERRSIDWAQVRPEWGLARNASFIIGPRSLTKNISLEGRAFLHSYDYQQDIDGAYLSGILLGPMVVAHWINMQYLFSTIDNVAYGGGSKITKNITGKIGIMQGNASDLMHGLPLQSVYSSDTEPYHQPLRLMTVIYAPRRYIEPIIEKEEVLKQLFVNGWITLVAIEPIENDSYYLERNLKWKKV